MTEAVPAHPTEFLVTNSGRQIAIDVELAPVVRNLWRLGYATSSCCQDIGESALIAQAYREPDSDSVGDACRLLDALLAIPPFADRIQRRWHAGSWRMQVPISCASGSAAPTADAVLHFPNSQIPELVEALEQPARP